MKPTHGAASKYSQMQMTMCLLAWHICIWIMIHSKEQAFWSKQEQYDS